MSYCRNRVINKHPGTNPTHHLSNLISHLRFITVYWTFFARHLLITKLTSIQSLRCIINAKYSSGIQSQCNLCLQYNSTIRCTTRFSLSICISLQFNNKKSSHLLLQKRAHIFYLVFLT